jgi:hypothetical protein
MNIALSWLEWLCPKTGLGMTGMGCHPKSASQSCAQNADFLVFNSLDEKRNVHHISFCISMAGLGYVMQFDCKVPEKA